MVILNNHHFLLLFLGNSILGKTFQKYFLYEYVHLTIEIFTSVLTIYTISSII